MPSCKAIPSHLHIREHRIPKTTRARSQSNTQTARANIARCRSVHSRYCCAGLCRIYLPTCDAGRRLSHACRVANFISSVADNSIQLWQACINRLRLWIALSMLFRQSWDCYHRSSEHLRSMRLYDKINIAGYIYSQRHKGVMCTGLFRPLSKLDFHPESPIAPLYQNAS